MDLEDQSLIQRTAEEHGSDTIVVLGQGRVLEVGRHEELMERDGAYSRLYAINYGLEEVTADGGVHADN